MTHREKAIEYFRRGYNCAQSVFAAFCDVTGYSEEDALRISSSFGGGMGRMREVCGACSAMFMVAGVVRGYTDISTNAPKKEHYELIQTMAKEFEKEHGTIICRELLSSLKPDSKPTPSARTEEYYRVRPCVRFVATAADVIDKNVLGIQ